MTVSFYHWLFTHHRGACALRHTAWLANHFPPELSCLEKVAVTHATSVRALYHFIDCPHTVQLLIVPYTLTAGVTSS